MPIGPYIPAYCGISLSRILAPSPVNPFLFLRFFHAVQLVPLRSLVSFGGAGRRVSVRRHAAVGGGGVFSALA